MARPESPKDCDGGNVQDCKAQCDQNIARACYRLGWFTELGEAGTSGGARGAIKLYDQACSAGMAVACRALGTVYANGTEDINADRRKSREYFQKACDLGIPEVCPPPEKEKKRAKTGGGEPEGGASGGADGSVSVGVSVGK
jgi:TPR repeat protein